jgi:hypothetical protein
MEKLAAIGITIFLAYADGYAQDQTISFVNAWQKINGSSSAQEASRLQTESVVAGETRASRHWLPKVYIDAKSYQTNDPGNSFFGLLEQRSINQTDFNPDSINHPNSHLYTRGALGLDLALYEGGMKASQVDLFKHSVAAQKSTTSQIQMDQYSMVGLSYGSIAVLEQLKVRLESLNSEVARMIKGYQLGSKSNPVGYSGLLGMRSLANRINGLINQYEAQGRSYRSALNEMGLGDQKWAPEKIDSNTFVSRYFISSHEQSDLASSYKIDSAKENVKISEEKANMEKAKFLPRVGAFVETFAFNGNRNTANGYSAGLYLQWNLFDPSVYGSLKEAKLRSMSAAKYSEALVQQERAERAALYEAVKSLRQNIDLLNDSQKLFLEQSKTTTRLFNNGSINALQIVEVLNRHIDLITQQGEAELGLIKAASQIVTKQKFDIDKHLRLGASNDK